MNKAILIVLTIILLFSPVFSYDTTKISVDFHGMKVHTDKLNYDSLYAKAVDIKQARPARELIDACIDKYGGFEHLKNLQSYQLVYSNILHDGSKGEKKVR